MFQMFVGYACVLSVAAVYYTWRDGYTAKSKRDTTINQRVAYLLWVTANRAG